jgi:hypothetical protein
MRSFRSSPAACVRRLAPLGSIPLLPASLVLASLLLASLPACSRAEGGLADGDRAIEVHAEPVFTVGSQAGDRWDTLARVAGVSFGPDGRLHILDGDARHVLVVNPDGSHHLTFGTRGEGPGQFRIPTALGILADGTVAVFDSGHRAFLLFDGTGAFLRTIPVAMEEGAPGTQILPHGPTGLVSVSRGFVIRTTGSGPPTLPTSAPVRRFDLETDGEAITLHEAWIPPREMSGPMNLPARPGGMRAPGGGMRGPGGPGLRAFEPQPLLAALPDGRLAVADSSTYRIRLLDPDGSVLGELSRDIAPQPVGEREQEEERARRLQELDEGRGPRMQIQVMGPGGAMSFDQSQLGDMIRGQVESMSFWPEIPVIRELSADPEGRIWVSRSGGAATAGPTDLFGPDGGYLGTIPPDELTSPDAFGPGGLAAWIRLDELDVPYVEVLRVQVGG